MKDIVNDESLRKAIHLKVKNDYGIDLTRDEVTLCIIEQEQQKLSLFHDQIYPNRRKISRWNEPDEFRVTWDRTVDGWRAVAQRSGMFAGIDHPIHIQEEGASHPTETRVTVYRLQPNGYRAPFTGVARYDESVQMVFDKKLQKHRPNNIWATRPFMQCAVRAEVNALRMAFQDLGEENYDAARKMMSMRAAPTRPHAPEGSPSPMKAAEELPVDRSQEVPDDPRDVVVESFDEPEPQEQEPEAIRAIEIGDSIGEGDKIKMIAPSAGPDHDLATGESGAIYRVYFDGRVEVHSRPKKNEPDMDRMKEVAAAVKPVFREYLQKNKKVTEELQSMPGGISFTNLYALLFGQTPDPLDVWHIEHLSEELYKYLDKQV